VSRIYKILPQAEWDEARLLGRYMGSGVDRQDGFIHFSTAGQAQETARRHFAGQAGLVVLEVEGDGLEALRWDVSRGGELFPHLHGHLAVDHVLAVTEAPLDDAGVPQTGLLA
jgi:uncharacterized protein (DUF952 family)